MSRIRETNRIPRRTRADDDAWHRLAVLEQEIEEHRRWLLDDPLLQRRPTTKAA